MNEVNFDRYQARWGELTRETGLSQFSVSQKQCFVGAALLAGLEVDVHRDNMDTKDGWVADIAFGELKGGHLQLPHAGLKFDLAQSDVLYVRSKLLWHAVSKVTRRMRHSMVFFTHNKMVDLKPSKIEEEVQEGVW